MRTIRVWKLSLLLSFLLVPAGMACTKTPGVTTSTAQTSPSKQASTSGSGQAAACTGFDPRSNFFGDSLEVTDVRSSGVAAADAGLAAFTQQIGSTTGYSSFSGADQAAGDAVSTAAFGVANTRWLVAKVGATFYAYEADLWQAIVLGSDHKTLIRNPAPEPCVIPQEQAQLESFFAVRFLFIDGQSGWFEVHWTAPGGAQVKALPQSS